MRKSNLAKDDFFSTVRLQMKLMEEDKRARDCSFEHCHFFFKKNREVASQRDLMALHLFAFLANWGMLRNSFLLEKDYLFHRPVIDILCENKFCSLLNFDLFASDANDEGAIKLILSAKKEITDYYMSQSVYKMDQSFNICSKKIEGVTDTIVSKILLGTFGCVPGYDSCFKKALQVNGMCQTFGAKSLREIFDFARANQKSIREQIEIIEQNRKMSYPSMKIVDSYFWQTGYNLLNKRD